jgi:hypothetical protein
VYLHLCDFLPWKTSTLSRWGVNPEKERGSVSAREVETGLDAEATAGFSSLVFLTGCPKLLALPIPL